MTARSRAALVPPMGLFIFLDLITALSGVLVLITMFLTTFLQRGSVLFPGSAPRAEPALEADLRAQLREKERALAQAEALAEKMRWANISPREIRRMLRRLQGLPGEGGGEGEKSAVWGRMGGVGDRARAATGRGDDSEAGRSEV